MPRPRRLIVNELDSLLVSRNTRRYSIMSLTMPLTGTTLACTYEDAVESNMKFYEDLIRYINATQLDELDEIDRQQIHYKNSEKSIPSALCVKALILKASGFEKSILESDVDEIPIQTPECAQLRVDGNMVLTVKIKSDEMESISSEVAQPIAKWKNETNKHYKNRIRLYKFLQKKNSLEENLKTRRKEIKNLSERLEKDLNIGLENDMVTVYKNGTPEDEENDIDLSNVFNTVEPDNTDENFFQALPFHESGLTDSILAIEGALEHEITFVSKGCLKKHASRYCPNSTTNEFIENRCSALVCVSINYSNVKVEYNDPLPPCKCQTVLSCRVTRSEVGMLKFILRRMEQYSWEDPDNPYVVFNCFTISPDVHFV